MHMDATFQLRADQTRTVVVAVIVAVIGLAIVLLSAGFGQTVADNAVRSAGSLETSRYELLLQLNAVAALVAGGILLAIGTYVALKRI
jgi:hypothetical protein